ncbi:hypothetical protein [Acidipropionibacterium virtanenii]|uniref:Uncharacterized protein n=1 Tax=Acidipropionibacterium virtanenii TaxID=2057246 RepID=A0A344US64_9ACTN|nr:hypothetical protein [Acidipropionibacterium virtanenii]AXE38112.1 hypothetical protein JS278_00929 [Acidipropionibacterium virtanenii]
MVSGRTGHGIKGYPLSSKEAKRRLLATSGGTITVDAIEDPNVIEVRTGRTSRTIRIARRRVRDMNFELSAFLDATADITRCALPQRWTTERLALMEQVRDSIGLELPGR